LVDAVAEGAESLRSALREEGLLRPIAGANLLAPFPRPGVIIAAGMNYHGHLREMNTPVPDKPVSFYKSVTSVIGPRALIIPPKEWPDMVDWEGEFSAVIGKPCFRVSAKDALDYVAGYTMINDVSARNWVASVFASKGTMGPVTTWEHNILGKQFPTFCPMGPVMVTRDEIANPGSVVFTTTLNGKIMQSADNSDLVFGVEALIEYYSRFYRFLPGDVISTGSPSGVGYGRNPKVFLRTDDVIEVNAPAIGALSNPVGLPG